MAELQGTPRARPQATRTAAAALSAATNDGNAVTLATLSDDRVVLFLASDLDAEVVITAVYGGVVDILGYLTAFGMVVDLRANQLAFYKGTEIKAYRLAGAPASGAVRVTAI